MNPDHLWEFLLPGYVFTVLIETPVLLFGLSSRHGSGRRLFSGVWLTACTYPIVVLVLPLLFGHFHGEVELAEGQWPPWWIWYLVVAETFAPLAECALFWIAFGTREELGKRSMYRDFAAILCANLLSFGLGELFRALGWFQALGLQ